MFTKHEFGRVDTKCLLFHGKTGEMEICRNGHKINFCKTTHNLARWWWGVPSWARWKEECPSRMVVRAGATTSDFHAMKIKIRIAHPRPSHVRLSLACTC